MYLLDLLRIIASCSTTRTTADIIFQNIVPTNNTRPGVA
jgi:hypothetical protein